MKLGRNLSNHWVLPQTCRLRPSNQRRWQKWTRKRRSRANSWLRTSREGRYSNNQHHQQANSPSELSQETSRPKISITLLSQGFIRKAIFLAIFSIMLMLNKLRRYLFPGAPTVIAMQNRFRICRRRLTSTKLPQIKRLLNWTAYMRKVPNRKFDKSRQS
jgi:hypothetical protein